MPRVAALTSREALSRAIDDQLRMVVIITGAVCCLGILGAGMIVTALFSGKYASADPLLRWFMLGNALRLPSLVMSYAILARSSPWTYLVIELAGGAGLLAATALGLERWGLEGAGIAFAGFYLLYLAGTCAVVGRMGYRPSPATVAIAAAATALTIVAFLAMQSQ